MAVGRILKLLAMILIMALASQAGAAAQSSDFGPKRVRELLGPWLSPEAMLALGGSYAQWEERFEPAATKLFQRQGTDPTQGDNTGSAGGDYYGRTRIWYVWWARTGKPVYLDRARAQARGFVDWVLSPHFGENTDAAVRFTDPEGTVLYLLDMRARGDDREAARALEALGRQASLFSAYHADFAARDNRERAYMLRNLFWAAMFDAPSLAWSTSRGLFRQGSTSYYGSGSWRQRLGVQLERLLSLQESSGRWRTWSKPFQTGLLHDALILIHDHGELIDDQMRDRIGEAVLRSLDYIWSHQWREAAHSLEYSENPTDNPGVSWPDLNAQVLNGFGWSVEWYADHGRMAEADIQQSRLDALLRGAVDAANLSIGKQFNQQYSTSYLGLGYAFAHAPLKPDKLRPSPASASAVALQLKRPPFAIWLDYRMRSGDAGAWSAPQQLPSDEAIRGLALHTGYELQVRGRNDGAEGPWSDPVSFETAAQARRIAFEPLIALPPIRDAGTSATSELEWDAVSIGDPAPDRYVVIGVINTSGADPVTSVSLDADDGRGFRPADRIAAPRVPQPSAEIWSISAPAGSIAKVRVHVGHRPYAINALSIAIGRLDGGSETPVATASASFSYSTVRTDGFAVPAGGVAVAVALGLSDHQLSFPSDAKQAKRAFAMSEAIGMARLDAGLFRGGLSVDTGGNGGALAVAIFGP